MKLSSKGRYGIRALFDIAYFNGGRPTQVKDTAERQVIPPRFLEQIFQDLKRAGLVCSKRGPQGGYSLAREARDIRLGEVISVLEGPVALVDPEAPASSDGRDIPAPEQDPGPDSGSVTHSVLTELSSRIEDCLNGVTVQDICDRADAMGIRRGTHRGYTYVI